MRAYQPLVAPPARSPVTVQAQLTVRAPGDRYEHEADRVAERVTGLTTQQLQRACACGGTCSTCQADQEGAEQVQRGSWGPGVAAPTPAPTSVDRALRGPGAPLDAPTRGFMESRLGHDFGAVRVHTDAAASASAEELGARAYTVGRHIVFGAGHFVPGTNVGRRLLAHELIHTIQQGAADGSVVQRAMKFEFQTRNIVFRANGSTRRPLIREGSAFRKFGPPTVPPHSFWLHKGTVGTSPTDKKEGSAIELQSETGSVLEFETATWFSDWCDLQASIEEAVAMTEAIDHGDFVETSTAGHEIRKWPSSFGTEHLRKTKNFKKGLRSGESLEVEIVEPEWRAAIQASEAVELPQYESLLSEQDPALLTSTVDSADRILSAANTEGTPAADLADLRGFLQMIVNYVLRGQKVDLDLSKPGPGRDPAKFAFTVMSRTNFASIYRNLLSPREKELFQRIVSTSAILSDLSAHEFTADPLTSRSRVFKHGHGGARASRTPTIHAWLRSIHRQGEKRRGRDLLSPPRGGSAAMGAFGVESDPGKKDTELVKFELRGTASPRQPRSAWVPFAKGLFKAAFTTRNRTGSTALTDPDAPCPP